MHKISLLLILGAVVVIHAQYQRSGPPPGYFQYGRGSTPSTPGYASLSPQNSFKRPGKPTGGPSNIMGWFGSQMAKLPSMAGFTRTRPPYPYPQQKYKQAFAGLPPSFSSPPPSAFGGGSSINSISTASDYLPPASPAKPSAGMTPQNTIFQIISADGSSRYQASPPPGYENFFGQQGVVQEALSHSALPPRPTPPQRVVQQHPQHSQQQQVIYDYHSSPGQQPLYGAKTSGNMEVIPSKMVSYEKQTLSTGHPEYQSAMDGMSTLPSNGYPVYYQQQQQQQQQPQQYRHQYLPQQNRREHSPVLLPPGYNGQTVEHLNSNLGSMLQGVSPDIAPIYDLSALQQQASSQDVNYAQQQASSQDVNYAQQQASSQDVNYPQQQASSQDVNYPQQQVSSQDANYAQQQQEHSYLDRHDTQADYSEQQSALSVVQPPSNFQYPNPSQPQDLQVAESNNQVHIVNNGDVNGNPSFEVFADANAPTNYDGHPFDINKLISMIEPGAQVDPKDIVSEDQENSMNYASYTPPGVSPPQEQQGVPEYGIASKFTTKQTYKNKDNSKLNKLPFNNPSTSSVTPTPFLQPTSPFTARLYFNDLSNNKQHILKKLQTLRRRQPNDDIRTDTKSTMSYIKFPDDRDQIETATDSDTLNLNRGQYNYTNAPNSLNSSSFYPPPPKILYHTIQPSISSNVKSNPTNSSQTAQNDNHNYRFHYRATPSPSSGFPVNPLYDSVLSTDNESDGKFDQDFDESRVVYQYAITVTPPSSMFEKFDKQISKNNKNATAISRVVSPQGLNSTSMSISASIITPKPIPQKRFPVYQRKSLSV